MIKFKTPPLHPTNEELAYFIDGKIIGTRKEEIEEHLVYCDGCMDVVVEVKKRKNKASNKSNRFMSHTLLYMNNLFYNKRVRAVVLSGMVASFLVVFLITKSTRGQFRVGDIDLSQPIIQTMSSSPKYRNKLINGDKVVQEIDKEIDKTVLSSFIEAQKEEAQKNYDNALNLYKKSFRDAIQTFKRREKLKWQIVIYYHIARIKFEQKDKDSNVYKKRVQFWIQQYVLEE